MTRISTKKLAIAVLAAIAALLIAFGFMLMRPIAFADTVSTFKMEDGAAVRYGAGENENGIRFSARISKSEYETLTAGAKSVESGTFIMPAAYYAAYGAISEEACFGATNVYYYEDANGNFVGKDDARTQYKILNAVGVPKYIQEETAYAVFGSVVSILDANLNVPLIARSYLKITPQEGAATYLFADMNADINKNVRSVLSVSQNALLSGVTGAELDTVQGYFNKFVELNPDATAKYTEKYSIVDVSGKREDASLTAQRTAKITAFDGKVTTTVPEGYKNVVGYEGYGSEVLKVGGATVLNSVIEKDNAARIIFDAENPANTNAVVSSEIIDADKAETWSWDGTKCAYFTGDLAKTFGWDYSTPMALPYAADVFSFTVKSSADVTLKIHIQGMAAYSTVLTDGLATIEVAKGVSKVYFVSDQPMRSINKVFMYSDVSIQGEFAIDYFAYENGVSVNGESGNLSLAAEATAYDITAIGSTVFSGADLIENVTVSYLELNDVADEENEYTVVDKVADKYTLSVKGATSYIIKINVSTSNFDYEKKVYLIGDHGLLRESFEEGENSAVFSSQYDAGIANGYLCSVTNDWALDGSNSMRIRYEGINPWWCGPKFDTALTASDKCSYVSFWFFASSLANSTGGVQVYFYTDTGKIELSGVFKTGLHKYTLKTTKFFTKITGIEMSPITQYDAYIDLISAGNDIVKEPFVRAEGAVMDFEAHENGNHFGADNGYTLSCPVGSTSVSDEWSSDGDYSWKVTVSGDGWAETMNSAPVTVAEYNTITFDININRAVNGWEFYVYFDGGHKGGTANLQEGVNRVTFTFENWSQTTFKGFECRADGKAYNYYYIDRVVLSKV